MRDSLSFVGLGRLSVYLSASVSVEICPDGEYTSSRLFGQQGEQLRAQLAANATARTLARTQRLSQTLDEDR
jgi:hypothetical protein